jgi:CheY-like chemotaxis protein
MDGHTAITRLRADPALQHIPIMVVSALPGWDAAGGDLAMGKPLDEPRFLQNIHSLLGVAENTEAKKVHFLILYELEQEREQERERERDAAMAPGGFTALCEMDYCPVNELSARIQSGFQGMVVVPTDLLDKVDLHMLNAAPSLEVMIMPVQMAARTTEIVVSATD